MSISDKAKTVLNTCRKNNIRLTTVESCTGGLIITSLTDIAGSSDVVECGFITYSNKAKSVLVGVDPLLIITFGAVSKQVSIAMAEGALIHSNADIAVSTTGIAGPTGGTPEKPVGLVHLAIAFKGHQTMHYEAHFHNDGRESIRHQAVLKALDCILKTINNLYC